MNVLDLFSGIGGFSLGLERVGMKTAAFVEIEPFCQKVLKKHWPDVPIYNDIRGLDGKQFRGIIDVVCGGYPCQPFSVAGKQKGSEDKRHLWPEMFRIIREVKPRWVIAENVEGHIRLGLDTVLNDLEAEGYTCWTFIIPACAVGAPHQRNRVWIIAHSPSQRRDDGSDNRQGRSVLYHQDGDAAQNQQEWERWQRGIRALGAVFPDPTSLGLQGQGQSQQPLHSAPQENGEAVNAESISPPHQWEVEPPVGRVADGVPDRTHRLKSLGNSVVPKIPELIGQAIMEYENGINI